MDFLGEFLLTALLFGSIFGIIYVLARYNYLIRKLALEKGFPLERKPIRHTFIEVGCVILGIGVGLGICSIYTLLGLPEDTFYFLVFATLFICGGIGLLIAHFTRKRFGEK